MEQTAFYFEKGKKETEKEGREGGRTRRTMYRKKTPFLLYVGVG